MTRLRTSRLTVPYVSFYSFSCIFRFLRLAKTKYSLLMTVSMETVRVAKSRLRKSQLERSESTPQIIKEYIVSQLTVNNTPGLCTLGWKFPSKSQPEISLRAYVCARRRHACEAMYKPRIVLWQCWHLCLKVPEVDCNFYKDSSSCSCSCGPGKDKIGKTFVSLHGSYI